MIAVEGWRRGGGKWEELIEGGSQRVGGAVSTAAAGRGCCWRDGREVSDVEVWRLAAIVSLCVCVCIMNLGFTDLGLQNVSFICFYIFIFFNLIKRTKHGLSSGFWCSDRTRAQKHSGIENQYPNPFFWYMYSLGPVWMGIFATPIIHN